MSERPTGGTPRKAPALTIEELAQAQGVQPVRDAHELAADIWESDEELDAFLADDRPHERRPDPRAPVDVRPPSRSSTS